MGDLQEDVAAAGEVFDANVALGRRHDRRVTVDSVAGTLVEMDRVGVDRAVVYSTHAVVFDTEDGNMELVRAIGGERRLVPQFVCNPSRDHLSAFQDLVGSHSVRSIRMLPAQHGYPLVEWVVGPWLDWAASAGISVWMPVEYGSPATPSNLHVEQFGAAEFHEVMARHPKVTVVLSEAQYRHANWALKLLGALPNAHLELSRFVGTDAIPAALDVVAPGRLLFGSRFPESPMGAQLYSLRRCGLDEETLSAICAENLDRVLGRSA